MSRAQKLPLIHHNQESLEGRQGLVYARVSSKKQETEGSGLQSQEERCIRQLITMNVPYIKSFQDSFSGGGDFMNRPAMRELFGYIDNRPQTQFVVIFDDLTRFARDLASHFKLRKEFKARGVILKCLNHQFDESVEGIFIEGILAGKSQLDREQNQRQVVQKMKARLDAGYWPFSSKKGYSFERDLVHGKLCVPNEEGAILKEALELFASGNLLRKIDVCRYLGERDFWKGQKNPPEARISHVARLLADPFNCGDIEYLDWDVARRKGHHQRLIDKETYDRIQLRLSKNETKRIRLDVSDDFPLRGLILCECCNKKLTAAWTTARAGKHAYYSCQTKGCTLRRKSLKRKDIETNFQMALEKSKLKGNTEPLLIEVYESVWKQEVASIEDEKYRREARIRSLESDMLEYSELAKNAKSMIIRSGHEAQMEKAGEELLKLKSIGSDPALDTESIPYRTALKKVTLMLNNPYEIWKDLSTAEQHRFFHFIFEDNLVYSRNEGYRTADELSSTRLFENFVNENTTMCSR